MINEINSLIKLVQQLQIHLGHASNYKERTKAVFVREKKEIIIIRSRDMQTNFLLYSNRKLRDCCSRMFCFLFYAYCLLNAETNVNLKPIR